MKVLSQDLQDHLSGGATTLCWCWKVSRRDGVILGFTDHDRDVAFEDTIFEAASGFTASDARQAVGLNVDNQDIDGALQSDRIAQDDLAAGAYDDARVDLYRVNWTNVAQRVLMRSGTIGEVTRTEHAFQAEVRGLTHYLGQQKGRIYQRACDADLGDARCGVSLVDSDRVVSGNVDAATGVSVFETDSLAGFASNWFGFGLLNWTSGANAGRDVEVKSHRTIGGTGTVTLWEPMRNAIAIGDGFDIVVGCDKQISTCQQKFSNVRNFRGFPHIPGASYVTFYPHRDDPKQNG